jgi:hypothetical protein
MSTTTTTKTVVVDDKALASVRGALAELGDNLGQLQEGHFSKGLAAMAAIAERVQPIVLEARKIWVNLDATKRSAADYTPAKFIEAAATTDDKYKAYAAGTPARAAMDNLVNYCLLHSVANEGKYKSYALGAWDLADYCKWLPKADTYGTNGKLLPKHETARKVAAKRSEVTAEVSADTRMFGTDVNTYVASEPTQASKLSALLALQHDVNAQIAKLREVMTPADKKVANNAYRSLVSSKINAKVEKKLAK